MPSSTTLSMAIRQPNWSEVDTLLGVFHAQRVCLAGNPCGWPNRVPPQRRVCVYDAVFFNRNVC